MDKSKKVGVLPIECVWGVVCSLSSIDRERNNVSLFNIVEQFNIPKQFFGSKEKTTVAPINHEIVTFWRKIINIDDREMIIDFEISWVDPTGKSLAKFVSPLKCDAKNRRTRFKIQVAGLPLTVPGDYVYKISTIPTDGGEPKHVFNIPLDIREI